MSFPGWCRRSLLLLGFSDDDDGLLRSRLDFSFFFSLPFNLNLSPGLLGIFLFFTSLPLTLFFWLGLFTYGVLLSTGMCGENCLVVGFFVGGLKMFGFS